ncbi:MULTISPECIES: hypothetical protein [unclassified Brevundimonas]|uniref:hypothetical protein n=1 Tax=unclassified Brevundimonas TaxID=2622653 RepID=UPI003F904B85
MRTLRVRGRAGRFLLALGLAAAIAAVAVLGLAGYWRLIGGGPMSVHGWIAMGFGVLSTVGLAWGLMTLAFRSDREGWDDRVDNRLDPGRDEAEDDDLHY